MSEALDGGGYLLFSVLGVVVLGLAILYGTTRWNQQRQSRPAGTIGRKADPAPKRMEGRDDRPAAT